MVIGGGECLLDFNVGCRIAGSWKEHLWFLPDRYGFYFLKFKSYKDNPSSGEIRTHHEPPPLRSEPPPLHPIDPSITQKKNIRWLFESTSNRGTQQFVNFSHRKSYNDILLLVSSAPPLHPIDPSLTQKKKYPRLFESTSNRGTQQSVNILLTWTGIIRSGIHVLLLLRANDLVCPRMGSTSRSNLQKWDRNRKFFLLMVLRLIEGVVQPSSGCKYMLIATMHNKKKLIAT